MLTNMRNGAFTITAFEVWKVQKIKNNEQEKEN